VQAAPDGDVVADAGAFVVGEPKVPLGCTPNYTVTVCDWILAPVTPDAGSYVIEVAAPGYETVELPVTLSLIGHIGGTLSPDTVTLTPRDGG
jgi:hypothetical protein